MKPACNDLNSIYQQYWRSLRTRNIRSARRWAELALSIAPDQEEPWLYLAAVASPRASLYYLHRALEINPDSLRARQGIRWALKKQRHSQSVPIHSKAIIPYSIPSQNFIRSYQGVPNGRVILLTIWILVVLLSGGWLITTSLAKENLTPSQPLNILAQVNLTKATRTPTYTPTFTPTTTPTATLTPTTTPTPTFTPTFTETPLPTETHTPEPPPPPIEYNIPGLPEGVGEGDRWIDIDLSEQRTYAYEGSELVNSFIVSTGTWQYPTVTGTYRIYVKYRAADMSGPGYYLPSVPYVMYFYKGYGLHGTYWHNNFGTPMSHGCVNLRTEDAGWLFEWADVGTVVHVHY